VIDGLRIFDADCHVLEPNDVWSAYIDARYRHRAPSVRPRPGSETIDFAFEARLHLACQQAQVDTEQTRRVLMEGKVGLRNLVVEGESIAAPLSEQLWQRGLQHTLEHYAFPLSREFDAESQASTLRAAGIDRAFVYPTAGLWLFAIESMDSELAAALVRAYNRWIVDFCAVTAGFLTGVPAVCMHDPEEMVRNVARAAEAELRCVYVRPNPLNGRTLGHAAYEPFWSECESRGVGVAIHEGTHARVTTAGDERFATRFGKHACSHPLEQMMAFLALVEGGVLDRHPTLRVAFLESGCGWLPYWLWRLDEEYENLSWEVAKTVRMRPSEYFARQCFISCEPSEPGLELVVNQVGASCLLYGSDYPHIDHRLEVAQDARRLVERVGRDVARQILWGNPCRFYDVEQ
jgi:uncharacterized protein